MTVTKNQPREFQIGEITSPVIDRIEAIAKNVPGWSPVDQLYTLFNMAYLTTDVRGDIVEIGSWCGRSTAVLGMAARMIGNTKVHSIDLFPEKNDWKQNQDGSYSLEVELDGVKYRGYQDQNVWREPFEKDIAPIYEKYNSVLEVFNETLSRYDLRDIVIPFRGDSQHFGASVGIDFRCKLAFIDGDHSYDAVCLDIRNVQKFMAAGGWICFDDAFSSYDGVNRAIKDCVINNPAFDMGRQMTRKFFVARKKREG